MAEGEPAGAPDEGPPPSDSSVFAVKTTVGHEQEVADEICARALKEKADVRSVLAPRPMRGYVLVEAPDFDRLTNLVASVRHARGAVRSRNAGAGPEDAAIPLADLEQVLSGDEVERPPEGLEWLGAGTFKGPQSAGRPARGAAPPPTPPATDGKSPARGSSAKEGGALPPLSPRAARWLNLLIIVPVAAVALGLLLAPRVFWDGFLEPYFWRSIEADASNVGGTAEAYNIVNTLAYAVILVPAVLLIYRVLERLKVKVDARFVLMLTPFLVLGGAARALEDSLYFGKPLAYAFISPIIYIAEGLLVLLLVVASWWVARQAKGGGAWGPLAWSAAFAPGAAALVYLQMVDTRFVAAPVPAPILLAALACAYLAGLVLVDRARPVAIHGLVLNAGLLLLAVSAYLIARWIALGGWYPDPAQPAATHLVEVPAILGLASLATALTLLGLYLASWRFHSLAVLLTPINGLLFFAQFLDGAATFWGVDMFGYQEKHVLPGFLMSVTGTAAVMFPLKLVYVVLALYLIDVLFRKDMFDERGEMTSFAGLLKLTIAAVGMGPGTRDMLRLAMGV